MKVNYTSANGSVFHRGKDYTVEVEDERGALVLHDSGSARVCFTSSEIISGKRRLHRRVARNESRCLAATIVRLQNHV